MSWRIAFMVAFALLSWSLTAQASEFRNVQLESQVEALFAGNCELVEIKLAIFRLTANEGGSMSEVRRARRRLA